jgi:hypothetical protein
MGYAALACIIRPRLSSPSSEVALEPDLSHYTDRLDALQSEIDARIPGLRAARRKYFRTKSAEDRLVMEMQETECQELHATFPNLLAELEIASGIDPALLEVREAAQAMSYDQDLSRSHLADENVEITRLLDDYIPDGLERLRSLLPPGWLEQEQKRKLRPRFQRPFDVPVLDERHARNKRNATYPSLSTDAPGRRG